MHAPGQVQIDLQSMIGIGGGDEPPRLNAKQVIFSHDPSHALMVHQKAAPLQFSGDPAVPVPSAVLKSDLLDR
jgi:hypothetical protein